MKYIKIDLAFRIIALTSLYATSTQSLRMTIRFIIILEGNLTLKIYSLTKSTNKPLCVYSRILCLKILRRIKG